MSSSPRATRKEESRDRILEVASRSLRRSGFDGVGVADVMKQAGLTHGGFYAHFASRDELLSAAAERAGRDSRELLQGLTERLTAAGVPPLRALIETYLHEGSFDDRENGCPVAALVAEIPRQSESVQTNARRLVTHLHRLVQDAQGEGGSPECAWPIAAAMVGALELARAVGDCDQARAILSGTKRMLLDQFTSPSTAR